MKGNDPWFWLPALVTPVAIHAPAYAVTYLTVEQAQHAFFPESSEFKKVDITLNPEQKRAIERAAHARVRVPKLSAWRVTTEGKPSGWFLVDEVLGKHEFITYAVSLDVNGTVRGVEILDYTETHGEQVRNVQWRAQFLGKRAGAPLKLDDDIANIAGATLSCKHVADGVRRLLATFEVALK